MMRLAEIMNTQAVTVFEGTELEEIVALISENGVTDFAVVNANYDFQGMIYESDLLRVLYPGMDTKKIENINELEDLGGARPGIWKTKAGELMTRKVRTFSVSDSTVRTGAVLLLENIRIAPVLEGRRLAGTVTQSHVFEQLIQKFEKTEIPEEETLPQEQKKESQAGGGADRRFFRRVPFVVPMAYKIIKNSQGQAVASEGKIGKTVDASAGGVMALVEEALPLQSLLQVALDFYRNEQPVRLMCRVVRCLPAPESGFFRAGLMYLSISPEERRRMNRYLDDIQPA